MMDQVDTTVTGTAGPVIRADLGGDLSVLPWLSAGYTLPFAVLLVVGGRLGDIHGRRRMFLVGMAGFTLASLACALAPSAGLLIGARAVQGAFGALLIPQGFGIVRTVFAARQLGLAMSMFAPSLAAASVCGPVLAGALIGADLAGLGWRMVFLVNVPPGLLAMVGALAFLPRTQVRTVARLDVAGVSVLAVASTLLVWPLVQGREWGWPWWCLVMIAAGLAGFGVFAAHQRKTRCLPVVEPTLLTNRVFVAGLVVAVAFFAVVGGFLFAAGMFLQLGLGLSPLRAALTTAPLPLGIVAAVTASRWIRATRRKLLHAGMTVVAIGAAGFAGTVVPLGPHLPLWALAPSLVTVGFGMGLVFGPLYAVILAGVGEHELGSASGTLSAIQQFGGALGISVLATVYFTMADPIVAVAIVAGIATLAMAGTHAAAFLLPREASRR
ncbi:MFS transporter [Fodinicola acaciae]|uniref:MFS transporter n=1 Tax=Fodinicola acaciae TaxID=2681555 RepID=UPI0013CF9CFC